MLQKARTCKHSQMPTRHIDAGSQRTNAERAAGPQIGWRFSEKESIMEFPPHTQPKGSAHSYIRARTLPRQMPDGGKRRIPSPTDRNSIQLVHILKAPRGSGDREIEMPLHMPHGLVMPGTNYGFRAKLRCRSPCSTFFLKNFSNFPGGPVVMNLPSKVGDVGSIRGQGTKIPHASGQLSPEAWVPQ